MSTEFRSNVAHALKRDAVQTHLKTVVDRLRAHRQGALGNDAAFERLRNRCEAIRADAIRRLPDLLQQFESKAQRNGIQVHWAETTLQANQIVLDIMQRHRATFLVKGKSMVSEEMGVNAFLQSHGIGCLETDLGEFIVQLAGEKPAHIIVPAIHKNRREIASLIHRHFPGLPYSEDIETLAQSVRHFMRDKFRSAPVGLTGVNFMVAETGTLCLVENEGNGRMCSTLPPVHIAVTGIEKVIARLEDLPPLLNLLTRSATGQPVTAYVNMINSPRRPGDKDGPDEVHLILLDNGRSRIAGDPELLETLHCIRCGACINHCPVYRQIGGHAYGTVIPGPIGAILEPQKQGLDAAAGELPQASTLCGACAEVCPVRIPIPAIINRLRWESVRKNRQSQNSRPVVPGAGSGRKSLEALIWKIWAWCCTHPRMYNRMTKLATRLRNRLPADMGAWTAVRKAPKPAQATLHERLRKMDIDHE